MILLCVICFNLFNDKGNGDTDIIDDDLRDKIEYNFTEDQLNDLDKNSKKYNFEAEVQKLMGILVDSLYENKDIFLRELISNANDALDKIRFQSLKDPDVLKTGDSELKILLDVNENERTLTITDTGIGMTKKDLIENLGRIAKSGTNEFKKFLQGPEASLIGQFGVGFYSSFLVADKVTVITKHNSDNKQWIWASDSSSQYTIAEDPRGNTLGRGTQIVLHLKDNAIQYLDRQRVIAIARHYSMFVDFPVKIWKSREEIVEEDEKSEEPEFDEDNHLFEPDNVVSDDEEDFEFTTMEDRDKPKGQKKIVWEWFTINSNQPIWMRNINEISDAEYNDFFKSAFKEGTNPMYHIHYQGEGRISFSALLYIPSTHPSPDKMMLHTTRNVRLYVKRVLVNDEWNDELLPDYLHFIKGVIDSNDLVLNVDRDHLSKEGSLKLIKRRITTKIISQLKHIYQFESDLFTKFYKNYAPCLKYGVIHETGNNKRELSKLLMFYTSYSPNVLVTLDDYVSRMKKEQKKIYYIGSSNRESAAVSPYLEDLYSRGIEVIFAIEPIDLYCLDRIDEFDGIKFENPEQKKDKKSIDIQKYNLSRSDYTLIAKYLRKVLGDKIEKMELSTRLKSTPAICSATNWGFTASHERLIRAQTVHDQKLTDNLQLNKKILELNPLHPLIQEIFNRIKNDPEHQDEELKTNIKLIYDTALIAGGFNVDGSLNYTKAIFSLFSRAHNIRDKVASFEIENKVYYKTSEEDSYTHKRPVKNIPQPANLEEDL